MNPDDVSYAVANYGLLDGNGYRVAGHMSILGGTLT